MPLYEYLCEACQERTEVLQKMGEPALTICPRCGGSLRKLFSAPSFQFKGSGWYLTDYAKRSATGEGGSAKTDEKSESSQSEKPAAASGGEGAEKGAEKSAGGDKSSPSAAPSGESSGRSEKPPAAKASE